MVHEVEVAILPKDLGNEEIIKNKAANAARVHPSKIEEVRVRRRSIDARQEQPLFRLRVQVFVGEKYQPEPVIIDTFQDVSDKKHAIIVGAGPTGYFAALEMIELGIKPIVFDRGKKVQERRRDLKAIQQEGEVDPNSNYCFGEGGAGTYSDGKLYTRSHKRGKIKKALQLLVEHGANSDILIDAHPHIGSNKLPKVVENIRETILKYGGEIHFESLVTDLIIEESQIRGVIVNEKEEHLADATILATGHSARDIFYLLRDKGVYLEQKPFALGVRIEHPQPLIDKIQYSQSPRQEELPAASYSLVSQVDGRGVFSFCMCPGGLVVPAATAPGEIVVNGMSMSRRDSPFANSGVVVAVEHSDFVDFIPHGTFAGLEFQKSVEQKMWQAGDGTQRAPAQLMTDFVKGETSKKTLKTSYIPDLFTAPLHELLPSGIRARLQRGFQDFGKKMKGYFTENAQIIGTESRTSSPLRIPRDRKTYMHHVIEGFFPAGEGAGYAGGIISAAMDGQNVAKAVAAFYTEK